MCSKVSIKINFDLKNDKRFSEKKHIVCSSFVRLLSRCSFLQIVFQFKQVMVNKLNKICLL